MISQNVIDITRLTCSGIIVLIAANVYIKRRRAWVGLVCIAATAEIIEQVIVMAIRSKVALTAVQSYYLALTAAVAMNVEFVLYFLGFALATFHFVKIARLEK